MRSTNLLKNTISIGQRYGIYALGCIILVTLAIRFAIPVRDGDLFWHLKYGQYMVENRTLVPDHSLYSWTPANNKAIYCTWLADIFLYALHQIGGLPLLFAFRYVCMLILICIIWVYAWRIGQGKNIFTFLVLLVVLLASFAGSFIKPEIMSMIFMAVTSFIYFSVKASFWGRWGTRTFLLYPVLFLVWVNTHGVFIFGLILLGLITLGEILNFYYRPGCALSVQGVRHLTAGAFLSLAATFVTPYGYKLHLTILNNLVFGKSHLGIKVTIAYNTIFQVIPLHYVDYLIIMLISFGALFLFLVWKKQEWDWAILLPTLFLALVFERYLRCTYYLPPFWAMSMFYLRKRAEQFSLNIQKARTAVNVAVILLFLFLSFRVFYDTAFNRFVNLWLGFGTGYYNPAQASKFLKEHRPGRLLYNSYDIGGYLMYDLYPIYKVFIDPRYFPYKEWFEEYVDFTKCSIQFDKFLEKYPFDVAIMNYTDSKGVITEFGLSQQWEPVFYGPLAIIFVKRENGFSYDFRKLDKHRFDNIHTLVQAYTVFVIAQNLADLDASRYILQLIKKKFSHMPGYKKTIMVCNLYQNGLEAFARKDYEKALRYLSQLNYNKFTVRANMTLTLLRNWMAKQFFEKGQYRKALRWIKATLLVDPNYTDGLYNAGIIGYMIEENEKSNKTAMKETNVLKNASIDKNTLTWKDCLKRFLKLAPNHKNALVVSRLLEGGDLPKKVPLIFPVFKGN